MVHASIGSADGKMWLSQQSRPSSHVALPHKIASIHIFVLLKCRMKRITTVIVIVVSNAIFKSICLDFVLFCVHALSLSLSACLAGHCMLFGARSGHALQTKRASRFFWSSVHFLFGWLVQMREK